MATEQKALDTEARTKLVIAGILILSVLVTVGLSVSSDKLGLRGTLTDTAASAESRSEDRSQDRVIGNSFALGRSCGRG